VRQIQPPRKFSAMRESISSPRWLPSKVKFALTVLLGVAERASHSGSICQEAS